MMTFLGLLLALACILLATHWRPALRLFVVLVVLLMISAPAFAQESGSGTLGSGWVWGIIAALVGLGLNFFGNIWSLWVAHAAKSEAKWDDWSVARFRDLARTVLKEEQSGTSPIPPEESAAK